jgi:hypothetical protein
LIGQEKNSMPQKINQEQGKNLLKYIDDTLDETVKMNIFSQLGHECFHCNHLDQWIDEFKGDVEKFLDSIKVRHQSRYWESLVFSTDKSQLTLTGKEVDECACPFADCSAPPLSLCHYCCKSFQEEIFKSLLDKQVEVTITESYLWGNRRCSTVIAIR